jgi:hypothetical protein
MSRRAILLAAIAAAFLVGAPASSAKVIVGRATPHTAVNFRVVGHNPLFARGMNAALAVYRNYVYVGDRTDNSDGHTHPGVLVLNAADPHHPRVVGRIGPPLEDAKGMSARELRVWPQQRLLMVLTFPCSSVLHGCATGPDTWSFRFYDLSGAHAAHPKLIATYRPAAEPHEMFLWVDPRHEGRAILYYSTPNGTTEPGAYELAALDISHARQGSFHLLATATFTALFKQQASKHFKACGDEGPLASTYVHSIALTANGRRAFLSYWCGEMLVVDTSELAAGTAHPQIHLLTPIPNRPQWGNPHGHSAVPVPGRPYVLTTDEVYGSLLTPFDPPAEHDGCPWGWVHLISVRDPSHPHIVGQYKIQQDTRAYCQGPGRNPANNRFTSFASHNPTVLPNLAFVDWHSGGLQAIGLRNPAVPRQAGFLLPRPLPHVATEDPALSSGNQKVVFWSYPIIHNGLIYLIDIRNGLYIVRYTGPGARQVSHVRFLEGNSNLGAALRFSH